MTTQTHFDAIVVGTGPGGATVARGLAAAGRAVLILERGGDDPITGQLGQAVREIGRPGKSLLITNRAKSVVRALTTGGSSIYYYGTACDPPHAMFDRHGVDLRAHVASARRQIPIGPLPDRLAGPASQRIADAAQRLGLPWGRLDKFIDPDRCTTGTWLDFYSAPNVEAKWNARMWVDEAVSAGATLVTRAPVGRVAVTNGAARGVDYTHDGTHHTATADTVIVAAGGIGTPTILRASGITSAGYDLFDDPLVAVMGTVDDLVVGDEIPMTAGAIFDDDGYVMTDMRVPTAMYRLLSAQVGRLHRLGAHSRTLQIMVKARDDLSGRITDRGGLRKPLSRADRAKLDHGYQRARAVLTEAGATGIYRSWYLAAHPGAGAKIGDVVDANLETDHHGLYVSDASVIPDAWGLPPTLTIVALALRLVDHLTDTPTPARAATDRQEPVPASP